MPLNAPRDDALVDAAILRGMIVPARTALLIIDAQADFVAPDGAMARAGCDLSTVPAALDRVEQLIHAARVANAALVFIRVISRPETDIEALKLLMSRKGYPPQALAVCRADTPGAEYFRVSPKPADVQIEKALFSSFHDTPLEQGLRAKGIDTLVVAGFTSDCGIDCTVRDAFHRNFNVFVVADACAAYSEDLHIGALNSLATHCALLVKTQAVVQAWASETVTPA